MMNIQTLTIDINKKCNQIVTGNTGEAGTRFIRVSIIDNGLPFDLEGLSVLIYAKKIDGTKVFNDVTIEDPKNGVVLAELTSQILAIEGLVKLTLLLREGQKKLATKVFNLKVDESPIDEDAIESSNEFGALTGALSKVDEWNGYFDENSGKIEEKYTERLNKVSSDLETIVHQVNTIEELKIALNTVKDYHTISIEKDIEITEQINIKNNITLTGKGIININTTASKIFDLTDKFNIIFNKLRIVCNSNELNTHSNGIFYINNSNNIKFIECDIDSNNRNIFSFNDLYSSHIEFNNNKLKCNGVYSFVLFSKERSDSLNITTKGNNNIIFTKNYIYNSNLGLLLDVDDSKIISNSFYKVNAPIACLKVKNTIINENNLKAFTTNGICLGNGTNDLIINTTVSNNVLDGYDYDGTKISVVHGINVYKQGGDSDPTGENQTNNGLDRGITISNNTINGCGNSGIFAYGNGNLVIDSNTCMNSSLGILVGGGGGSTNIHPGKIIISNNITKNNDNGISVGSGTIQPHNCIISGNMIIDNTFRGLYIARVENGVVTDNIIRDNGGCGFTISSINNISIKNNTILNNITKVDAEGFNGQVAFGISGNNEVIFADNTVDTRSSIHYISNNLPKYMYKNKGIRNNDSIFITEGYVKEGTSQTLTINVPLPPSTSSWSGGQLLIQASGNRTGSSNVDHSHSFIGILNIVKLGSTINIRSSVDTIYKSTNTSGTITCSAVVNSDNQSVDITVNTNYSSTNWLYITVKPMKSLLFINNF